MSERLRRPISAWTVDYGDGRAPREVSVPHAWRQDVSLTFEGPVTYRTVITVPVTPFKLRFHGVSYRAEVFVDGVHAATHEGIWDAFEVPLTAYAGRNVNVEVRVTKNGGPTFPVKDVASGFLPFVYHTFGGIHGDVELVPTEEPAPETIPAPPSRVRVDGHRIHVDDRPFYPRGLLTWGWYPNVGHTNPPENVIWREVAEAKRLGFNLVKFCLWVPPHRYLEILKEQGMEAWLELPLWDPTDDPVRQQQIAGEIERIVRQYRRHDNIVVWTVGCELSEATPPEYRQYLYQLVRNLTGCPLVKDNSGGAEMYGGDLREFGDFYDFHPYCDTPFYPAVLDTLVPASRKRMPILLGEFNDIDVHRDLSRLGDELPYWVSSLPELNDQGVRWQYDLPGLLPENRFALYPERSGHRALMESSRRKALFMRKVVHEAVRARQDFGGYAITGWRDTPISASGFFDDWDAARFSADECLPWNGPTVLFLIPTRRPPWVHGGNRPGFLDSLNHFVGQVYWRVGVHSEHEVVGGLVWSVRDPEGRIVARGTSETVTVAPLESQEVGQIHWQAETPGEYRLQVELGDVCNEWPIWIVEKPTSLEGWQLKDPRGIFAGLKTGAEGSTVAVATVPEGDGILFLLDEGTLPMPFWRESTYEFPNEEFWSQVPFAERWERLLPISPDRVIDPAWLAANFPEAECQTLLNRIDTRTYVETPVLVRVRQRNRTLFVTTLRPQGGLGTQPTSLQRNPAGYELLRSLCNHLAPDVKPES